MTSAARAPRARWRNQFRFSTTTRQGQSQSWLLRRSQDRLSVDVRFSAATAAGAGGLALTACTTSGSSNPNPPPFDKNAITSAEAARPHTGRTVDYTLNPQGADIDLGGITVRTLAYGDSVPGPLIRANVGDELAITVNNGLDHQTSVHWHGIRRFATTWTAPCRQARTSNRGRTSHTGSQYLIRERIGLTRMSGLDTDYGLYLPIVVDDPREPVDYDAEWIVVLDDWTDGVGTSPQQILSDLQSGNGMGSMGGSGMGNMPGMGGMNHGSAETTLPATSGGPNSVESSALLGGDAGDVSYPYYLINGRIASAPTTFSAAPGQRVRIRIINAGADTAFRVALADHVMSVTHTDGSSGRNRQKSDAPSPRHG